MMTTKTRRTVLTVLTGTMGVVATGCGALLASGNADLLQMDPDVLSGTPFDSFLVPGLLLTGVVGGANLLATAALLRRERWARPAAFGAGCTLIGWMAGQLLLIGQQGPIWQQPLYLVYGLICAKLAWVLDHGEPTRVDAGRRGGSDVAKVNAAATTLD